MSFFGGKRQLKILTLASKTQHSKGRYVLSFDVLKNTDYGKIKEKRQKEEQVYEELTCIAASCSGDIEISLNAKRCQFKFTVSGALKPATPFETGEDILEYNDSMPESRRHVHLTPTYDEDTEGQAFIKFWHGEQVKHTVTICDVPVIKMSSARLSSHGSEVSLSSQTSVKYVDDLDRSTVDFGSSIGTAKATTLRVSGSPMSPAENQAKPVYPNSPTGPTCVGFASGDGDEGPEEPSGGETAYDKIVSSSSLQCLSLALPPQDSQKLLIHLQVPSHVIEQKKKDHPGDIVSAMFHCFLYWRGEKRKSSEANQDTNKHMYEDLIKQLAAVGRNDIKSTLMKVLTDNRELKQDDFKHL